MILTLTNITNQIGGSCFIMCRADFFIMLKNDIQTLLACFKEEEKKSTNQLIDPTRSNQMVLFNYMIEKNNDGKWTGF